MLTEAKIGLGARHGGAIGSDCRVEREVILVVVVVGDLLVVDSHFAVWTVTRLGLDSAQVPFFREALS